MGGYGAIRNGLKYHDNFSRIVAFSSALTFRNLANQQYDESFILTSRSYAENCFGNLDEVEGSDKDLWALLRSLKKESAEIPKFYMACGTGDRLLAINQEFAGFLCAQGVDVTFEMGEGAHEWDFWHRYIKRALDWLPLEETKGFLNSGNVTKA